VGGEETEETGDKMDDNRRCGFTKAETQCSLLAGLKAAPKTKPSVQVRVVLGVL
jgi:hypothetical protein